MNEPEGEVMEVEFDKKSGKYVNKQTGEEVEVENSQELNANEEKDKKAFKHILG